jgi:transposase
VLSAYDKQHIAPGTITPQLAEYGITLLGNYRGLPLYASESQYTDVDGTSKYFVPADKVLVAASGLPGTLAYAGIVQVDEDCRQSLDPQNQSRRSFPEQHPQVHFHFTPTYSSWLNQIEIWFSKIQRDIIARGVFAFKADLARKIMRYIRHYNKAAVPFRWSNQNTAKRIRISRSLSSVTLR